MILELGVFLSAKHARLMERQLSAAERGLSLTVSNIEKEIRTTERELIAARYVNRGPSSPRSLPVNFPLLAS